MSNLRDHAIAEFRAAGWTDEHGNFNDDMQKAICDHILKLLEVFADEKHSGTTAPYTINLFTKLAKFEPIAPLTGEDWEWSDCGDGYFQNKRMSGVFKHPERFNGQAYWIDGIIFWEWFKDSDGEVSKTYFTNSDSFVPITFPWTPPDKPEHRFQPSDEYPNEVLDGTGSSPK